MKRLILGQFTLVSKARIIQAYYMCRCQAWSGRILKTIVNMLGGIADWIKLIRYNDCLSIQKSPNALFVPVYHSKALQRSTDN